ncbi:hypothetical protein BHE74_00013428 [Ensete ventricosum]|nr:hypothetical protein GW17_00016033 [Ensete ventricosum]RWW78359.1 hypothetical protein BHE74_00013428 [Ensete ventricosum]
MENSTGCKHQSQLLAELARTQELVVQLEAHLDQHSPIESCKSLSSNILLSIEKLIHIAGLSTSEAKQLLPFPNTVPQDPLLQSANKNASAANFNSVCRDRNTKRCFATKQVQRSDEDPQAFDVIYHGTHTCRRGLQMPTTTSVSEQARRQNQANRRLHNDHPVQQQNKDLLMDLDAHESCISSQLGSVTAEAMLPESIHGGYSSQPSLPDNCCCFGGSPAISELIDVSGSPTQLCVSEAGLEPLTSGSFVSDSLTPPNSAVDADITLLELDTQFGEFLVSCSNLLYTM